MFIGDSPTAWDDLLGALVDAGIITADELRRVKRALFDRDLDAFRDHSARLDESNDRAAAAYEILPGWRKALAWLAGGRNRWICTHRDYLSLRRGVWP